MLKRRIIGSVILKDNWVVQSVNFRQYLPVGRLKYSVEFLDRWVRYKETILGSDGKEFKPCFAQKAPKSLKSDLYALKVLFALELLRLFKVAS